MHDSPQKWARLAELNSLSLLAVFVATFAAEASGQPAQQNPAANQQAVQDFEAYRSQVEPIFLKQSENGVGWYDCHSTMNRRLRVEPLAAGSAGWTEAESRRNFERVLQLIVPEDPLKSRLLMHPLAAEAG